MNRQHTIKIYYQLTAQQAIFYTGAVQPFAALWLRTDAANRYKKVENATVVIRKMLMLAERRFRRLDAPGKLIEVYLEFGSIEALKRMKIKREYVLAVV